VEGVPPGAGGVPGGRGAGDRHGAHAGRPVRVSGSGQVESGVALLPGMRGMLGSTLRVCTLHTHLLSILLLPRSANLRINPPPPIIHRACHLGATIHASSATLVESTKRSRSAAAAAVPTVIVLPQQLPLNELQSALAKSCQSGKASGSSGGGGGTGDAAAWLRVLSVLVPPALVFYEGQGEGLLTACRLWKKDGHPTPGGDAGGWTATLRRYQLHAGGVCIVASEAALQHVPAAQVGQLLGLLAAARRAAQGVPADWSLALRQGDLRRLGGSRPDVAARLNADEHMDAM